MTAPSRLQCLECGRAVDDPKRWVCSQECRNVLSLVWSGRRRRREIDEDALPALDLRRQVRAAGISGRFPEEAVLNEAKRATARPHQFVACATPGCPEKATRFDWQPGAGDARPRAADVHLRCEAHHIEAARAFVSPDGRIEHSAAATWARMEAAEPLVARDDPDLWPRHLARLLTQRPLGDPQTVKDLGDCLAAALPIEDGFDRFNDALARLPIRRQAKVVRSMAELILRLQTMTASERQDLLRDMKAPSAS